MANAWNRDGMGDIGYGSVFGMGDIQSNASVTRDMMERRNENRLKETYGMNYDYSIVGIDATKVEGTIQIIDSYVKRLEDKIKTINESADMNKALKSEEIQTAVKNYITKVEEYCANLCSMLRNFKYKLQEAHDMWDAHASDLSFKISDDASTINNDTRLD